MKMIPDLRDFQSTPWRVDGNLFLFHLLFPTRRLDRSARSLRSKEEMAMRQPAIGMEQIESILERAMTQSPVRDSVDETKLAGYGLAMLRSLSLNLFPDEQLRERCADYAAHVCAMRRRSGMSSSP
jgi:hypothetical protein